MTKTQLKIIDQGKTIKADLLEIIKADHRADAEKAALFGLRDGATYREYAEGREYSRGGGKKGKRQFPLEKLVLYCERLYEK